MSKKTSFSIGTADKMFEWCDHELQGTCLLPSALPLALPFVLLGIAGAGSEGFPVPREAFNFSIAADDAA
jgi:hypothetical protein